MPFASKHHGDIRDPVHLYRRGSARCAAGNYDRPAWARTRRHYPGEVNRLDRRKSPAVVLVEIRSVTLLAGHAVREFKARTSNNKVTD
jgi:hypothetical protein